MTRLTPLRAVKDYIYGTFKIRRILLLAVVLLSLLFTRPVLVRLAAWLTGDLVYVYLGIVYITGFFMYGAFKRPLKTLIGSILLGRRFKPREFTPEEYESYGVAQIVNEMGIKKKVRVFVTTNPWIEGPFTNAATNKVYIPAAWMARFPRLDLRGVLGHELGHIKTKRKFERDIAATIGGVLGLSLLLGLFSITMVSVEIFELALAFLVLTVVSWRNERRADLEGARVTGPEPLISVFELLKAEDGKDDGSETHPSLSDRIARLCQLLP